MRNAVYVSLSIFQANVGFAELTTPSADETGETLAGETGTGSTRFASNLRTIVCAEAVTHVFVSVELSHDTGPSPSTTRYSALTT